MKTLQIDVEKFMEYYYKHLTDEQEQIIVKRVLIFANNYLKLMQQLSPLQQKREIHAKSIAHDKRYETKQRIAEYARRSNLFDNDAAKYRIANIAKHINRTDATIRNTFVDIAKDEEIKIPGKLQQHVQKLCELLIKRHRSNL